MGVMAVAVEGTVLHACRGGASRVLLAGVLLWSRSVPCPRVAPTPIEGSAEEKVRRVGSTVTRAVPGMFAQGVAGSHRVATVPGMAEQ